MDHFKSNSTYSRFASGEEIRASLHEVNINDNSSLYGGIPLYSETTSDSIKVYIEKDDVHTLIIGSTGSKKTRLIGMPALNMYALAGESFIATDPKAELYERTLPILKKRGYNIFVLNLRDPLKSNSWNPLFMPYRLYNDGFRDKATELITDMANCIIKKDTTLEKPYWQNSAANLLTGLILALFECANEKQINLKSLRTMRSQSFMSDEAEDGSFIRGENSTFIREKFLKYIDRSSFIFPLLSGTVDVCEVTRGCIVSEFDQAMQPFFSQDNLIDMLSGTDIDMENFGKAKTAVFLIIPDENTVYHSLISVFVKQCYTVLIHSAQKQKSKKLSRRVNFLLDEFSSLPQISDFPAMMTASRSRNIRFNLIIQSINQLAKRYGFEGETIKGNCENWVFLHSREVSLLKEIIELSGNKSTEEPLISTIKLQTMDKNKGEAFFLIKRHFPYFGNLPDVDQYPQISANRKKVKYPENKNKVHSVFDFEEFCLMASPESLSKLFLYNNKFVDTKKSEILETIFTSSVEEDMGEREKGRNENMQGFLTGLSNLTNKYRFMIDGCGSCLSLYLYDAKYMGLYKNLKYNDDTNCYEAEGFEPDKNEEQIEDDNFADYMECQNIKCGYGWYGLIFSVLAKTRRYNIGHPDEQIEIICFKENHGSLQIMTKRESDSLKNIFDKEINASTVICEYCGCTGKLEKRGGGEYKTLYPECGKKNKKKKIKPSAGLFHFMQEQNIYCGYGWYGLIFPIIAKLKKHNDKHSREQPDEISSIDEKCGRLRINIMRVPDYLRKLIDNAPEASKSICEYCGCPGNSVTDSQNWLLTLCRDCFKLHEEELSNNKRKYGEESIPEFLSELSALTQKHEIKICEGCEGDGCPKISSMENFGLEYQKLEYSWETGCYTLEGVGIKQEEYRE